MPAVHVHFRSDHIFLGASVAAILSVETGFCAAAQKLVHSQRKPPLAQLWAGRCLSLRPAGLHALLPVEQL